MTTADATAVLFVEDDERLAAFTKEYLTQRGLDIVHVTHGAAAYEAMKTRGFDAIVLDVMLPGEDGFAVCRRIRESSDVPILLVTARGEETDRVLGLELGADDYVVKPFSPRELLARVQAFVRRRRGSLGRKARTIIVGPLSVDTDAYAATLDGAPVSLSPTELSLLVCLMERPGRVLTREQLLELTMGGADEAFDRAIDVQVSRLRQKLGESGRGQALIKTIRGVGYMLVAQKG